MRNLFTLTRALPLLLLGAAIFCFDMFSSTASGIGKSYQGPEPGTIEVDDYRVSGPFTHQNLSLFLIRGRDELPRGQKVLTLDEALRKKKIKVRETSDVNELIFVNVSGDCTIFIMSGDIVKGGKQDRTIKFDVILGPRSGEVSIAVHCVEAGRWSGRGDESVVEFSSSSKMLATKKAKIGNRASDPHGGGQSEVWDSVAEAQEKLGASLEKDVRATASASSYQLTLEDKDVAAGIEDYERALARIVDRKSDVIGYVFAINGEINSADVFGSHELFTKVWPRLLEAAGTEALGEWDDRMNFRPATLDDVQAFLASASFGRASVRPVTATVEERTRESDEVILFETRDLDNDGAAVRRNYLKK